MEEYLLWFEKAKDDLLWTKHNIKSRVWYGACFTAQQAAEKSLKAYLLFKKVPLRKMYDTRALIELCMKYDSSFRTLRKKSGNADIILH